MNKARIKGIVFTLAFLCASLLLSGYTSPPATSAKAFALFEAGTGRFLAGSNEDAQLPMASTTKIMTCLLAVENCELDEIVTVEKEAVGQEGTSMYLKEGETLSVSDLVYGLMLSSGNDAAVMLALHMGGTVENFAAMMNARAREIGANDTNFVTPNGLPAEGHYTTAHDLGLIAATAMGNPKFKEIVGTQSKDLPADEDSPARYLRSKNRILWEYEGGNGIKTGYTKAAGKCLVAGAERDGMQLVAVVLNDYNMFEDCKNLLSYGFENYALRQVGQAGEDAGRIPVTGGVTDSVGIETTEDILLPLSEEEFTMIETKTELAEELAAPVTAGTPVGKVEYWLGEEKLAESQIVTTEGAIENTYGYNLGRVLQNWLFHLQWRESANR